MGSYRYLKFVIRQIRGNNGATQLSVFNLYDDNGNALSWTGATATATVAGFSGEGAQNILDGQTSTKYCAQYTSGMSITIDAGSSGIDLSIYKTYKWYTANDEPARDPITWGIYASNNGTNWVTVAEVTNATIPTERYALAYTGSLTAKYYLIESGGDYYTIASDVLTNIGSTLNAQLFLDYGMDSAPAWEDFSSLTNPSVLCWTNTAAQHMAAITTGTPDAQTIYSPAIDLTHADINGIETVTAVCVGNPVFAVSVDNSTWKIWSNDTWATLSEDNTGMSAETMANIASTAWETLINGATDIYIKWALLTTNDKVTSVTVDYLN